MSLPRSRRGATARAIANILFNPELIAPELRADAVLRALAEHSAEPYLALAAVVGLQRGGWDDDEQRGAVADALLALVAASRAELAERASLTAGRLIDGDRAARLATLLAHPDEPVRHNALAWLSRAHAAGEIDALELLTRSTELPTAVRDAAWATLREHLARTAAGELSLVDQLQFAHIPNLNDFEGSAATG